MSQLQTSAEVYALWKDFLLYKKWYSLSRGTQYCSSRFTGGKLPTIAPLPLYTQENLIAH